MAPARRAYLWLLLALHPCWIFLQAPSFESKPAAVLVHPDAGAPHFAAGLVATSWSEAGRQLARRIEWDVNHSVPVHVLGASDFCRSLARGLVPQLVLAIDWPEPCELRAPTRLLYNSSSQQLSDARGKLRGRVQRLLQRGTEEELIWGFLLLTDRYVGPVGAVAAQRPHVRPFSIASAALLCGPSFVACSLSPKCMRGMFCVAKCHLDDQSCAYKCLLKYESSLMARFSSCAFERRNVMGFQTPRPQLPEVSPLEGFDSTQLNVRAATRILMGHASKQNFSWLVAAASSEAYAQFPMQYQIWYYRRSTQRLHYKAVFLARTQRGLAWRERHYVALPLQPGAWLFAAQDGGLQLRERWYLLGADEKLRWIVLYFAGAAKKAGMAYRGCMLLTPDGRVPGRSMLPVISEALARAGLQLWEMRAVQNSLNHSAGPPPLAVPS